MSAILFGSIGTIADTSELQRESFNEAFAAHGLDWSWSQDEYAELLQGSGGAKRVADYAEARGVAVDADAVHAKKSELFQQHLAESQLQPRAGVVEAIEEGRRRGYKIALVTTTSKANVDALLQAVEPALSPDSFDLLVDTTDVPEAKPDPAAYRYALGELGVAEGDAVAIEDNVGGVEAAVKSGLPVVAFPNTNTAAHSFSDATETTDRLSFDKLDALVVGA